MEWLNKQKAKIKQAAETATRLGAQETHRQMGNRIFNEGKNSNGQSIGKYNSTDPIYVNPRNSPKGFTPAGKPGSRVKKASRQSKWFASYRAYRAAIGRETSTVNLTLFGLLKSDFTSPVQGRGTEYVSVLKNVVNQRKKAGLEKKFGAKIFASTKGERELFRKLTGQEFNRLMKSA
jgi:hypothetical protein